MLREDSLHTNGAPLLPKLRGHFAEFLNKGSLARLRILSLPTCVGLRYGHQLASLETFLDSVGSATSLLVFRSPLRLRIYELRFFLQLSLLAWTSSSNRWLSLPSCVIPSFIRPLVASDFQPIFHRLRYTPRLRSRLTLGGRAFPRKP